MNRRGFIVVTCLAFHVHARPAVGEEGISYFHGEIDYWGSSPVHAPPRMDPKLATPEFDWEPYLDPSHDEFFREGEYLPPRPFMAVARDPSDENLRRWFTYIEKRNAVEARLEGRMQEFLGGRPSDRVASSGDEGNAVAALARPERYVVRFYFEGSCQHCQKMAPEVQKLRAAGLKVEARQVDDSPATAEKDAGLAISRATPDELTRFNISAVPVLLIADTESGRVYRMSGSQTANEILRVLSQKD